VWHDITSAADAAFGWGEQHWAQVVGDIATVCGWIASVLAVLALVFAFICPPLAVALEGMALTLTELATVCDIILAVFGKGSWLALGLDVISLVTFGWGRNLLRAGEATVEVADEIGMEGVAARADTLSAGLESPEDAVAAIDSAIRQANGAEEAAITEKGLHTQLPGILGKFSEKALHDFRPENPVTVFKAIKDTDWENVLGKSRVQTIKAAAGQAAHMKSPELAQSLKELKEIPDLARITRLSGINFPDAITHYNKVWTGTQAAALSTDTADKIDKILSYWHVPDADWLEEHTKI
jgi:hypothetical protein